MYGEYNIFDAFSIDDAMLILEAEKPFGADPDWHFYWTLCVVQNQTARNLLRLYSNNTYLSPKNN